jgi:hypothetical protein
MAAVTTGGSGNWNSTTPNAPWPGGTIPAATDTITIANGHTLTIPTGYTAQCGDPAVPATHAIRTAGTDGTGRLICNGKLEISANVQQGWAHWEYNGAGVKLESKNTTTALTYLFGDANFQNGCRISLIGTGIGANRAIIQNGAGAAGLRFTVVGGEQQCTWQFAKFSDIGTAGNAAITVRDSNYSSTNVIQDVEFDNCGTFVVGTLVSGCNMTIQRLRVVNSKATDAIQLGVGANSSTGTRIFEDIIVPTGNFRIDATSGGTYTPTFTRCMFGGRQTRTSTGLVNYVDCFWGRPSNAGDLSGAIVADGNITRGIHSANDVAGFNWHGLGILNSLANTTVDGLLFDGVLTSATGDLMFVQRSDTDHSVTVRNVLCTVSPTASGAYGKMLNVISSTADGVAAVPLVENCTWITDNAEAAFIKYGETVASYAGVVGDLENNLIWGRSAGQGQVLGREGTAAAANIRNPTTAAQVTNNAVVNPIINATNGDGHYTLAGGDGLMWTSTIPTYTSASDPNMVDSTRNLATWYRSVVGGSPGTRTADTALAYEAIASQHGDSPVSGATITAAWEWIRAGFAPQNTALDTNVSANNGGWIGAVEGVSGSTTQFLPHIYC